MIQGSKPPSSFFGEKVHNNMTPLLLCFMSMIVIHLAKHWHQALIWQHRVSFICISSSIAVIYALFSTNKIFLIISALSNPDERRGVTRWNYQQSNFIISLMNALIDLDIRIVNMSALSYLNLFLRAYTFSDE